MEARSASSFHPWTSSPSWLGAIHWDQEISGLPSSKITYLWKITMFKSKNLGTSSILYIHICIYIFISIYLCVLYIYICIYIYIHIYVCSTSVIFHGYIQISEGTIDLWKWWLWDVWITFEWHLFFGINIVLFGKKSVWSGLAYHSSSC